MILTSLPESGCLIGRRVIMTDEKEITADNVVSVLQKAMLIHQMNRSEIQYLWDYYRGKQPILNREKEVRPEICNKIVENRANEIVSFKSGYLMGEPLQYVGRGTNENITDDINLLNEYVFAEEKATKDKELADWFHICGTAYRMILPDQDGEEDESPFEIYTLDPRESFVVYSKALGHKSMMGVHYVTDEKGNEIYSCYTKNKYFEVHMESVVKEMGHILGGIPIVEYPLNMARLGAFELVLPLLDAINLTNSNRLDGIEQFIQALMVFYNIDISAPDFEELRREGALKVSDADPQMKAKVEYLINNMSQAETQTLKDDMYQTVLEICGMPNRNGGTSTSDTGSAVIMRDGWSAAEARAKDSELMFKKSERQLLKMVLNVCRAMGSLNLKVSNIEIRFTRRNYENITQKAQVLDVMLKNEKIHPQLAFAHSGMFVDPELAYTMSDERYQDLLKKDEQMEEKNETRTNSGNGTADRESA